MTRRGLEMVRIDALKPADDQEPVATTVADVMRRDVGSVSPETSVHRAGRMLVDHETPALPVVDRSGHVVGIFSEEDLVARLGPRRRHPWWHVLTAGDQLAQEFRRAAGTTVADVITAPAITASPTLPLSSAALLFQTPRLHLVPVIDGSRLVGTVGRRDLLRGLVSEPEYVWESDRDLVSRMQAWMAEELGWVPTPRPAVTACNGLLILWGLVDTHAQKAALETMARAIPGCRGVESHLLVAGGIRGARGC
jgi:CBS domain-containing protein